LPSLDAFAKKTNRLAIARGPMSAQRMDQDERKDPPTTEKETVPRCPPGPSQRANPTASNVSLQSTRRDWGPHSGAGLEGRLIFHQERLTHRMGTDRQPSREIIRPESSRISQHPSGLLPLGTRPRAPFPSSQSGVRDLETSRGIWRRVSSSSLIRQAAVNFWIPREVVLFRLHQNTPIP